MYDKSLTFQTRHILTSKLCMPLLELDLVYLVHLEVLVFLTRSMERWKALNMKFVTKLVINQ